MLLTFSILIFFISLIEGFPTQDAETSTPPKPIIESGVYRQALDSYGNPVAYLEAAKAPDGRKFVQAGEGVQFEIPKYASGITEIKKPHSDLLPPLASAPAPSRLFIPPVFDEKQYSTADGKINSNPSTFSGAPTTSFAERLNFNKNPNQKEVIQDLLPPVETSANQFGISSFAGQEEEIANNESAPSRFANNPFLTKSTGTLEPKQENSAGTFGGAPGVLGNQKPGYAIRPSNNGSSGNIVNTSSTVKSQSPAIKNNFAQKENNIGKYSGGFGGPPGVLAPYDNV